MSETLERFHGSSVQSPMPQRWIGCLVAGIATVAGIAEAQLRMPRQLDPVKPTYSEASLKAGDEGLIELMLTLDVTGAVVDARVVWSPGCRRLDAAAVASARQWRFEPMRLLNGEAIPFNLLHIVSFRLPVEFKDRASQSGECSMAGSVEALKRRTEAERQVAQ